VVHYRLGKPEESGGLGIKPGPVWAWAIWAVILCALGTAPKKLDNNKDDIKQTWMKIRELSKKYNQQARTLMKSNEGLIHGIRHSEQKHNKKVKKHLKRKINSGVRGDIVDTVSEYKQ
jgi:hypothetical protein